MNDEGALARRPRPHTDRLADDVSEPRGRRTPALVIRLEVGSAPSVVADWDDDAGDQEFTRWIDENPSQAKLAYLACELAEEAA